MNDIIKENCKYIDFDYSESIIGVDAGGMPIYSGGIIYLCTYNNKILKADCNNCKNYKID